MTANSLPGHGKAAVPATHVNLVGRGRIGGAVADWLQATGAAWHAVGRDEPVSAGLTIDCAGPAALRVHGADWLEGGDVWTVGAAALIDPDLRARLADASRRHGTRLRLFTGWVSGPPLCPHGTPARLRIEQSAPGLAREPGPIFEGPLAEAAARFPDHLNTATAAALAGPGIAATTVALRCSPDGGAHVIRASFEMPGQTIETEVRFRDGPHPVAQAIIAALQSRTGWLLYG